MQSMQAPEIVARLMPPEIADVVVTQISLPAYLSTALDLPDGAVARYRHNEDVWADVLARKLNAASSLTLEGFQLNEWMPFSAGAFHTDYGRSQREYAQRMILYDGTGPTATASRELEALVPGIDPRSFGRTKIYSSAGKGGMIAGGIGCVRLKPRRIREGEVWFLSATASSAAHEGFVVALPTDVYRRHADEIAQTGSLRCTLTGELRFVDSEFRAQYASGVPQLYLLVSTVKPTSGTKPRLRVSLPISFQGADGSVNAAYANFWPDEPGALKRATEWLDETYVRRIYNGTVVTDFDEQVNWFGGAQLSLQSVMSATLDPAEAGTVARQLGLSQHMTTVIIERVELNGTLSAERIDTVHQDRVINIGDNAHVNAPIIIADQIEGSFNNIRQLPEDQSELRQRLEQLANAVNELARTAPEDDTKLLGSDLETLTAELARDEPRRKWYELSLDSLSETAGKLGAIGLPILEIAAKVAALL